jgi:O-antigen/teichoic acid export membrane protein
MLNYLGVVWNGGLSLLLVPIYLKLMGPDQWGVLAVCMTLQSLLGIMDAGLGQLMPRDIARRDPAHTYAVYSRAYLYVGATVFVLGQVTCGWWVPRWFTMSGRLPDFPELAVRIVLVQFAFQFVNNATTGFWNGSQAQRTANVRQIIFTTLKHLCALTVLLCYRVDVVGYLAAFAVVAAAECLLNHRRVRRETHRSGDQRVTFSEVVQLYREAGVLVFGVVLGMLAAQIDRITLSRSVELRDFGYYAIAASLGLAAMQLQYPIMRAYLPRLVHAEIGFRDPNYRALAKAVFLFCVIPCIVAIVLAPVLLKVWLNNSVAENSILLPFRLILAAIIMNSLYNILYQQMLILSAGRYIVFVNAVCVAVAYLVIAVCVGHLGIVSGGMAWVASSAAQLALGVAWFRGQVRRSSSVA